jgi:2,5-furandicarboxylate decarboxylase 1
VREQFPTIEKVAIPTSVDVGFRIVMAMKQHFAGEARAALLAAMATNLSPKIVVVVDPDIDVHDPVQVALMIKGATAFRMQPARDRVVVDGLPAGPLDPSVDPAVALDRRMASAVGIDATFPFGAEIRTAGARPVSRDICGPALAEKAHEYIEVADVPGWREYEFPELKGQR